MDLKEKVAEKRRELVDTLLKYMETNPDRWGRGWYSVSNKPAFNPVSNVQYKGLNAFYLYALSEMNGYKDPRWLTLKQVKNLGANVKKGERSASIFYWNLKDRSAKQSFSVESVEDLEDKSNGDIDGNVGRVLKFYKVFNAEQCENMPEYNNTSMQSMTEEEQEHQNAIIKRVINNSSAPILYGGSLAYYSPIDDTILLPEIHKFKTMQDYYATALHEIAHSTGHHSRLNRDISNTLATSKYDKEELSAELASFFIQVELGLRIDGSHFNDHMTYVSSWLQTVRNDNKEFFSTVSDAENIAEFVSKHYAQEKNIEASAKEETIFGRNSSFAKQVDAVLCGADTTSTHLKVMSTPFILRQLGANNLPILITAKHLKNIVASDGKDENVNYHGLDVDIVKKLPELLADPVMVMDSLTKDDSVVVLTAETDSKNRPVIAAIKFNGRGNLNDIELDANILTSTYGKDNFNNFIQRNIDADTVLYWNKEKSQELIKTPGIQFPDNLNSLATDIIIRKSKAFVNSNLRESRNNQNESVDKSINSKQSQQVESVEQAEKNRQVGQVEKVKTEWKEISLKKEQIVKVYGQSTMIRFLEGEYSSFVFLTPTKLVKTNEKKGSIRLSVRSDWKYELKNNGFAVELNGLDLCDILVGKKVGKNAKRVEPSQQNNRRLENIKENVPEEMKNMPNWCVYKTQWNREIGRNDEFVYSPILGLNEKGKMQYASIDKSETWATFDDAISFAIKNNCDGLSFAMDGNGISCIDLDNCIVMNGKLNGKDIALEEGAMNDTAKKLISELNGYCETSISGNDLHFFLKDDILSKDKYKSRVDLESGDKIEVYDNKRFVSITGNIRSNTNELTRCPSATAVWLRNRLGTKMTEQVTSKPLANNRNLNIDMSDSAVIERIRKSKNGKAFDELFNYGSNSGDHSRDELKLLNILAFFTQADEAQMARIFKRSALYNPDKEKYLDKTITKACRSLYGGHGSGGNSQRANSQSNPHR